MARKIATDAVTAWEILCREGGLELRDRDADFEEGLRVKLKPAAPTLQDALRACSTDDLIRGFFDVIQPFAVMFRAILEFFKAAGAREGRAEWVIEINEEHLELTHFEQFVRRWDALPWEHQVPAVDWHGAWAIWRAAEGIPHLTSLLPSPCENAAPATGIPDVDEWLAACKAGTYLPLPGSLHPSRVESELQDAASMIAGSIDIIRRMWPGRNAMLDEHRARNHESDHSDGFSPRTIAQDETDFRLFTSIACLSLYRVLSETDRQTFSSRLAKQFESYPRRTIGFAGAAQDLQRILSMPLWRQRHELYAVWIATELLNCIEAHDCELHHDNGRLTFEFRESIVATIHSTWPAVRLYAERRTPLADPIGSGRTANVQPDYGFWRGSGSTEECGLIIEVKHYKRAAPARFREVLTDYARAHHRAQVVLVNHGAAGNVLEDMNEDIRKRCHAIGMLTANHLKARRALWKLVQEFIGAPIPGMRTGDPTKAPVIAVDVSMSLALALRADNMRTILDSLAAYQAGTIALVDSEIRTLCPIAAVFEALKTPGPGISTKLDTPVQCLLDTYPRVLLITDRDGLSSMPRLRTICIASMRIETVKVEVVEVKR